jgi:exodeoxyribonuclease V gamma subunit
MPTPADIAPGFIVLHGNRLEDLRDVAVAWMRQHPLAPLENEIVLAQSNGVAQWLKLTLAADAGCGIAAALQIDLPARFLWRAYRAALGAATIPAQSPLDKSPLTWRLMRLLPALLSDARFSPLRRFLADDSDLKKRFQLAGRLADLFDQYQVYRADWLNDWATGQDGLRGHNGEWRPLDEATCWQPELWRALLADVGAGHLAQSRAGVHQRFLECLSASSPENAERPGKNGRPTRCRRPPGLGRRVTVFGISSLPVQTLEALAALADFCQVILCAHNPCRHYWGDIVEGRELLRHAYRRQKSRETASSVPMMDADAQHVATHPLLAAWGRQGRDYIHLLDRYDDPERYRAEFERIDLFSPAPETTLLGQLQNDILELRAPEESRALRPPVAPDDHSLCFHIAHSAQREVEILHDQLLAAFDADPDLRPRDVIVMMPDIDAYAPHIEAVFGQFAAADIRHIPYTLADRGARGKAPLVIALERLLDLPESRFGMSEIFDLLSVAPFAARFGLTEHDLPLLRRWLEDAGVRWGLDENQRAAFGANVDGARNTWRFGISRLLLGYAVGNTGAYADIEPCDEIGGLEAALLGPLIRLIDTLERTRAEMTRAAPPSIWGERLRTLLEDFFLPQDMTETALVTRLRDALEDWLELCEAAKLEEAIPLAVAREAWLGALDQGRLSQRFLAGAVNFCTLMPMRAIPFRQVCLLGMNDGDYPRQRPPVDFDLTRDDYRPGDRSRREDDRYLLLEALLSARERLYVSWVGRNIRDNSEKPPSALIDQLRDHLARVWRPEDENANLLAALTTVHPLQPFSRRYFDTTSPLFTYAHEWVLADGVLADGNSLVGDGLADLSVQDDKADAAREDQTITLDMLSGFLRNPVRYFFHRRLKARLNGALPATVDAEPFDLDGLQRHQMREALLRAVFAEAGASEPRAVLRQAAERLRRGGLLPLAGFGERWQEDLLAPLPEQWRRYAELRAQCPRRPTLPVTLRFTREDMTLDDALEGRPESLSELRQDATGHLVHLELAVGTLKNGQNGSWKWPRLLPTCVRHIAAAACGIELASCLVGEDETLRVAPLSTAEAADILAGWLAAWQEGMRRPLPVACKTAFAWLADQDQTTAKAAACYDGAFNIDGEAERSPELARVYPDFAALVRDGEFFEWAERLYGGWSTAIPPSPETGNERQTNDRAQRPKPN